MKKLLVSIFAVFYLGIASGATVHFHYCMGELLNWGFIKTETTSCSNCGMDKSDTDSENCCKDEVKQVKVEKAQKAESSFQFSKFASAVISGYPHEFHAMALQTRVAEHPFGHAPPRTGKQSVFVLNCNFRI